MTLRPHHTSALPAQEVRALSRALSAGDVTVFVDGTALRLPAAARDAVLDLLMRMGRGDDVVVTSREASGGAGDAAPQAPAQQGTEPPQARAAARRPASVEPSAGSGSNIPLLTTSQAAAAAGISHTFLRNLTDAGVIPVEYRGTHRRIRLSDIEAWLQTQQSARTPRTQGSDSPSAQ